MTEVSSIVGIAFMVVGGLLVSMGMYFCYTTKVTKSACSTYSKYTRGASAGASFPSGSVCAEPLEISRDKKKQSLRTEPNSYNRIMELMTNTPKLGRQLQPKCSDKDPKPGLAFLSHIIRVFYNLPLFVQHCVCRCQKLIGAFSHE